MRSLSTRASSEAAYAARLRRAIRERYGARAWMLKVHGGPFQAGGVPDFILCLEGCFIAIELKRPGKYLTPRQDVTVRRIILAGGEVLVVRTDESVYDVLGRIESAREAILSSMLFEGHRSQRERNFTQREDPALPV